MVAFFNTVLDTLIRNVAYPIRAIICLAFLGLAAFCLIKSIRKKNDVHPIAWGWFILCFFSMLLAVLYIAL